MRFHHHLLAASYYPFKLAKNISRSLGLISPNELRVLLYHDIAPRDQARFAQQLRWLAQTWTFITPERFAAMSAGHDVVKGRNLLLTFDDGFASNRVIAEEVLNPMGIRALFFVVTDFVDIVNPIIAREFICQNFFPESRLDNLPSHWVNMGWRDLEALVKQGHSIGSHTQTHARLSLLEDQDLENEIVGSADRIERSLGITVENFAYTFGDINSFSSKAMSIARRRYKFIYSGLRGNNAAGVSGLAIRRDASASQDATNNYYIFSNPQLGALLSGLVDKHYALARSSLDNWALMPE